jgi:hypothetical protein
MVSWTRRVLPILGVLTLFAAACGGGDEEPATAETTPAAEPSADEPTEDGVDAIEPEPQEPAPDAEPAVEDPPAAAPADEPPVVVKTLAIGFAYPDVSAFAILNSKFSIGDPQEQAAAVVNGWRRDGLLPINGHDIELAYRNYPILNSHDKRGVCASFAQDDEVFAVVSGRDFTVGAECLATRFSIPVIDHNAAPPTLYERGAPWFFTVRANEAEVTTAYVQWGEQQDLFDGGTIGVFWDTRSEEAFEALRSALEAAGHQVAVDIPSDGEGIGSPQDQISVERFIAEGVDIAILLVGTSSVTNFMAFAERQGYRPMNSVMEWSGHIGDVASASLPQEQFDGVTGMAISRVGEIARGDGLSPQAVSCLDNYERFSGKVIDRSSPENAEFVQILYTCDLMSLLYAGLAGAGDDVTPESFVVALEALQDFPLSAWGNLSYGPGDHAGVQQFRTVQWQTACGCWTAVTAMSDFAE